MIDTLIVIAIAMFIAFYTLLAIVYLVLKNKNNGQERNYFKRL